MNHMKLSAPVYALRSEAKTLKRTRQIPLTEALDTIARREGFASWSLLMSKHDAMVPTSYREILDYLNPGDLVMVAARPTMGKTTFVFGLVDLATPSVRPPSHIFSLSESRREVEQRLVDPAGPNQGVTVDCSDDINADYIIAATRDASAGSLVVIDYLQLLDEKRTNPPVQAQVEALRTHARSTGCIVVFICQLDRRLNDRDDQRPTMADIRLPNPLDLGLFNKIILLYRDGPRDEEVEVHLARPLDHRFTVGLDLERRRFHDLR